MLSQERTQEESMHMQSKILNLRKKLHTTMARNISTTILSLMDADAENVTEPANSKNQKKTLRLQLKRAARRK
jgi:hypothetical protein